MVKVDTSVFPSNARAALGKEGRGPASLMLGYRTIGDKREEAGEGRKNSRNELWNREEGGNTGH